MTLSDTPNSLIYTLISLFNSIFTQSVKKTKKIVDMCSSGLNLKKNNIKMKKHRFSSGNEQK